MRSTAARPVEALVLFLLFVGAVAAYLSWSRIVRLTADHVGEHTALWIEDADTRSGTTIHARVRTDGGERTGIRGVIVEGAGEQQTFYGDGMTWGKEVERLHTNATDSFEFAVQLPTYNSDAEVEDGLVLRITVVTITAYETFASMAGGPPEFSNNERRETFEHHVALRSQFTSTLRRIGRLLAALAACVLVVVLGVVYLRRRARSSEPSAVWLLALLPYAVVGYGLFARQLSMALHVYSFWFVLACMVVWFALLALPSRIATRYGMKRYVVSPLLIEREAGGDAYREAQVTNAIRSIDDLESVWLAAGLVVRRNGRELLVNIHGNAPAILRVSPNETFGGEPFEIRSHDRHVVIAMVDAAARCLGPLRCSGDPEIGAIRFDGESSDLPIDT